MLDARSPLRAHLRPGRYGTQASAPRIVLGERRLGTLLCVSGWREDFEACASVLLRELGFAELGRFDRAQEAGDAVAYRIAPERILLRFTNPARWNAARSFDPARLCLLDLSHSRSVITIAGPAAIELLMRVVAIDLDPAVFPIGSFAQTGLHSVPVLLHLPQPGSAAADFELHVPSSFAGAIWELLAEHACAFGYAVGEPG
jgi:heterotetrameric sarcosine oxidase gamma subunit